jgi:hypothetical protein
MGLRSTFIIWHSIPSILDQIKFFMVLSFSYFISYCRNAFVYWLASLIGIALLYFLFRDKKSLMLFFSFLAAITFPHVLVILKMMHQKIQKSHKKNRAISSSVFLISIKSTTVHLYIYFEKLPIYRIKHY